MISSDNGWSLHYASVNCTTHAWPWNSAVVAKRLHSKSLLNTTSCVEPCILRRASTQKMYRIGFAPANEPKMYTIDFGPGPAHASSLAQPGQRKPGRECGLARGHHANMEMKAQTSPTGVRNRKRSKQLRWQEQYK